MVIFNCISRLDRWHFSLPCLHFFSFCISLLSWYKDKSHAEFHNNLLLCYLLLRWKIIAFNCESSEGLGFPESSTVWRAHLSWRETHIQYWRNLIRTPPPSLTHPRTAAVKNGPHLHSDVVLVVLFSQYWNKKMYIRIIFSPIISRGTWWQRTWGLCSWG